MKDIVKGYLAAFISAVTYGMIPLFMIPIKQQGFSVDAALFYRFITTSVFIMGYLFYRKETLRITPREVFIFLVLGLLYALSAEFLFLAYDLLSQELLLLYFFMYPLIVALALGVFFKEHYHLSHNDSPYCCINRCFLTQCKRCNKLFNQLYRGRSITTWGNFVCTLYAYCQ